MSEEIRPENEYRTVEELGAAYERYVRRSEARFKRFARKMILMVALLGIGCIGGIAYTYFDSNSQNSDIKAATIQLRDGLVVGCQHSNDTVRAALRKLYRDQNTQTKLIDPEVLFPSVPLETLDALIQRGIDSRKATIATLRNVPCKKVYPDVGDEGVEIRDLRDLRKVPELEKMPAGFIPAPL